MKVSAAAKYQDEILTPAELARRYKVSSRTVLNWAHRGAIPAIRVGKVVRFRLSEVIAAVEGWPAADSGALKGRE